METIPTLRDRARHSLEASRLRREEAHRHRRVVRVLCLPAVVGLAALGWYVAQEQPYEYWYIAAAGVALILPWLTER